MASTKRRDSKAPRECLQSVASSPDGKAAARSARSVLGVREHAPQRPTPPAGRAAALKTLPTVLVIGAGKVGTNLARALRAAGYPVTLRAARKGLPSRPIRARIVIIAVRDGDVP